MALSATTATTRSTTAARASGGSRTEPRPGTPVSTRPATSAAAPRAAQRGGGGTGGSDTIRWRKRRLLNIGGLSLHVGAGLLGHEIRRWPVPVELAEQYVAAVLFV